MTIDLSRALTFMLVMMRMTGMLVFSPIFGRRNIPTMLSAGLAFMLSVMLSGVVAPPMGSDPTLLPMITLIVKELLLGFVAGLLFQMFVSVLIVGGEVIDLQLGISMSKAFDPGTNTSISVTAGFLNAMYVLIFFITNNHLTFIHMIAQTFDIVPVGVPTVNLDAMSYLPEFFSTILVFAMKLCLPIVVIEIVVTMAVGIIMRIIPQINVFVVNIQFKLFIGILMLVVLVAPFTAFLENMIQISFERLHEAWRLFS